ncbi:amyloid-beta A4 precursor protein-binding family A member 1-like isoform X8 [Crassostrea angulata]|uniref:amyloid-beta A4 precursor protein-binding family A member 1-like isoform X8 n=1 Tax=Magallana angulata TaxID=2784310 RepID=UPI0022B1CA64|nr:amyloid-beta A4 precursor protein-binding family A member 1-like isoform X8 [Crassostrea angulata]
MSDIEDEINLDDVKPEPSEPYLAEGACGGDPSGRPFSPRSDNFSLEVQFEEESSRHPSEISTLSYQNLLEEGEGSGVVLSRQESEDSTDSIPSDFVDFPKEVALSCDIKDLPCAISSKCKQDACEEFVRSERRDTMVTKDELDRISRQSVAKGESESSFPLSREGKAEGLQSDKIVNKRNSLEIRNNIPVMGEVKNYEKDIDSIIFSAQGAKPKIRSGKQSPGMACRVGEGSMGSGSDREGSVGSGRDTSSAERELEKSTHNRLNKTGDNSSNTSDGNRTEDTIEEEEVVQLVKMANVRPQCFIQPHVKENLEEDLVIDARNMKEIDNQGNIVNSLSSPGNEVENEYDYVKYARVQDGDSYVGMRLAYSSAEEAKKNGMTLSGFSNSDDFSRENSPEKSHSLQNIEYTNAIQNLSEDMLTEIPLDSADSPQIEEKQAFSLSPENTECDSVEVESIISDGEKNGIGMPIVEDGLSSSQASDTEEGSSNHVYKSPSAMLRSRQRADIAQELENLDREYGIKEKSKPKEMDTKAIMEDLKAKREALDTAIADIKTAIQQSKTVSQPYKDDPDEEEPVWVKREESSQTKKESLESVKEKLSRLQQEDTKLREEERVFQMENEKEKLLENQYIRNDGKKYQVPRGYDSDDDDEEGVQYTRNIKGKKYASLPRDDSFDHGRPRQPAVNGSGHTQTQSDGSSDSNEYNYSKRNRLNSKSDTDDYGSDVEAPSKTSYVKQKPGDFDTDEETDVLLQKPYQKDSKVDIPELTQPPVNRSAQEERRTKAKEGESESFLIEGVLFRAQYLGSTQLISEGQPSKAMRMMQAQEAVGRIKAPEGENQPSTAVDLFVSTEKIMVLNTDLQEIMMDHSLRTISYIADIGDILVIMARRRLLSSPGEESLRKKKQAKILCHVFESEEAQLIAQSIGQAFQVAYMEFLKANGIEDPSLMKEIDYQEVLNQQEIYGEELNLFSNKERQKEVIVPKMKGEMLGIVIVESGWGSMVPTVVLANMYPSGPAARCGQLNIGDQIISINGISLVGLPLSACQNYIKTSKNQTVVKLTVVPCAPVVEVLIKRPDVKYQLGFSVQNGVICSLLRGGIAERGGVRVGHRIIEINNQSVVAVPHEKIVSLLANSVGEIHMKTMPTSIYRLLTGQETPHYQ